MALRKASHVEKRDEGLVTDGNARELERVGRIGDSRQRVEDSWEDRLTRDLGRREE